jgi:N-acetylglucosamine-6-phosphate deacetylase
VTAPLELTLASLERLANAIESAPKDQSAVRARPRGIHLEGPFISHVRRGVHPADNLLPPSLAAFERFWQASRGHLKVMTIAPELDCALEVIAEAAKRGVAVSLGHSDANLEAARAGVAAGARHATHTFNAMRPLSHRDPGVLGVVLTDLRVTADIIADGVHVDPTVVDLFMRAKGCEKAVLITDATAATGMPEGHYRMGAFEFDVRDGKCLAGGTLAGSLLTLDVAVRNVMTFANLDLQSALRTATLNPAKVVGMSLEMGALESGKPANIAVFNPQHQVIKTIVHGRGV